MERSISTIAAPFEIVSAGLRMRFEKHKLIMPRYSFAIAASLLMQFPAEVKQIGVDTLVEKIDNFAPVEIGLNELADLSISARLARQSSSQHHYYDLLQLENRVAQDYQAHQEAFCARYPENEGFLRVFENDFTLLSKQRALFGPEKFKDFIELDSGIFVVGNIGVVMPQIIEDIGIDINAICSTVAELKEKYKLFLVKADSFPTRNQRNTRAQVFGLHCAELCLKINDDCVGVDTDNALRIPNYVAWANSQQGSRDEQFRQLRDIYFRGAVDNGISPVALWSAELLQYVTSGMNARLARQTAARISPEELIGSKTGHKRITSTLRHELDTVLGELFSRPFPQQT